MILHHLTITSPLFPKFPPFFGRFHCFPPSPDHPQRSPEASAVKRFLRHHEAPDLRFAEFVTPQRMVELFPLAGTTLGYSALAMDELNLGIMYIYVYLI